jgi:hypothetical protein
MQMNTGPSFDRPHEADNTPDDHHATDSRRHLVALAARLKSQFDVGLTDQGLVVRDRNRPGGGVTITCRRRPADGDRWWYFASCGDPITEVDRIPDTVVAIHGYLAEDES